MPVRHRADWVAGRVSTVRLEVTGRTLSGLAPWFACEGLSVEEARLRECMVRQARAGIACGSDPRHPDYWQPEGSQEALMDAAFLAEALLRAPGALWEPVDAATKERIVGFFRSLRDRAPWFNNWLLFGASTEAFLASIGALEPVRRERAARTPWHRVRYYQSADPRRTPKGSGRGGRSSSRNTNINLQSLSLS